jgi:hypothetical protein
VNRGGRKDGEKYAMQHRMLMAVEAEEEEAYPELQLTHLCQGQTYVHALSKWNVGSAGVAGGEDDVEDQVEDKLGLVHRNEEGWTFGGLCGYGYPESFPLECLSTSASGRVSANAIPCIPSCG